MKKKRNIVTRLTLLLLTLFGATTGIYSQCNAVIGTNINPISGCEVLTVQFSDNSQGVVNRSWDFGDGSPASNAQNPAHSFDAGQGDTTYTVTLTIECNAGSESSAQETVTVYAKPAIDILQGKSSLCAITDSVCLSNLFPYHLGNNYLWNFGDGTISDEYAPCKVYSTPGTYDLDLTVTNEHGCVNSEIKQDFVNVIPVPNTAFTVSDVVGCNPFTIYFTNITDTAGTSYSGWLWDYGDGSPEFRSYRSEAHTYLAPGKFNVRLGTSNSLGCSNFSTQTITVNRSPEVIFNAESPICLNEGSLVDFVGSASDTAEFEWVFTEASPATGNDEGPFMVSWETPGIKKVDLKVTDQNCAGNASSDVVVNPLSTVFLSISASRDTVCAGQEITFTASPNNYLNYQFFVNTTPVQSSHRNTYTGSGFSDDDKIYVKISDHVGCTDLISDTVLLTVLPTPVVNLASSVPSNTSCFGTEVIFTALPAGYDEYSFYIGNSEVQSGPSDTFITSDLTDGSKVYGRASFAGCQSTNSNGIQATVLDPLPAPSVNCGTTTDNTIEFVWEDLTGAVVYEVSLNGGAFQMPGSGPAGLSHMITGLNMGDSLHLEVRAYDGSECGVGLVSEQKSCVAQNCDPISFDLLQQDLTVCEGEQVILGIKKISTAGFSVSWDNGPAGSDTLHTYTAEQSASVGVSLIDSTQLQCPSVSREIRIGTVGHPTVSIHAIQGDEICKGSEMTFIASPPDYENYKFFNNSLIVQDGPGNTYTTKDPDDRHHYFVIASNQGCIEASDSVTVSILKPLRQPVVQVATSDPSSVIFRWKLIPGATAYMISINNGDLMTPTSGQTGISHEVSGLLPGEAVTAYVIALGSSTCGNSDVSLPATGFAEPCTGIEYSLKTTYNACQGDSITLAVRNISLDNYSISWGGEAPVRKNTRVIRAERDTVILVVINDLDKPECPGALDLIRIRVHEIPAKMILESLAPSDTVCEGDLVRFFATPAGYDRYEFYDGFRLLQTGSTNAFETDQWINGHLLTVLAKNNSCAGETSDPVKTFIKGRLKTPQVYCGSSTDSTISFKWDPIPGADGYMVSLDGDTYELPSSGQTANAHMLLGLNPEDSRSLSVVSTGPDPCGFSIPSDTAVCFARTCDEINFTHSPYDTICEEETLLLSISDLSTSNYGVLWNLGPQSGDTTMLYQGISDSYVFVTMKDLDQPGCQPTTKFFDVKVLELPRITLSSSSGNDTICETEVLEFIASPAGYDRYSFYNSNITLLQSSGYHIYETDTLTTDVSVYVETVNAGCHALSDTITTHVVDLPPVNLTASATGDICLEQEVLFSATPGYDRYLFKDGNKTLANTRQSAINLPIRSEFVTVEATMTGGCMVQSSDTIWFNLMPLPQARLEESTDSICMGGQLSITVVPGDFSHYEYLMNGEIIESGSNSQFTTEYFRSTDTLSAIITDQNGCRNFVGDKVSAFVWPSPENRINSLVSGICLGDSLTLEVEFDPSVPTTSFSWNTGSRDTTMVVSPGETTSYFLYSFSNGCTKTSDTIIVEVDRETPVAYAGEDATICIFDSLQLEATGGMNYLWSPDSLVSDPYRPDPFVRASVNTEFIVTVTNLYCIASDTMILYIDKCLDDLSSPVPQIITPNGDGSNDYWIVPDIDYFTLNSIEIYNRWGSLVFMAQPYDNTWDGRSTDGKDLPKGTYYYVVNLGNGAKPRVGYIIIHR
ncbi:MAG: PKD domain-containing protein [Bacteroidetes bacterium]|nr:PKD domain-containing protein [Bacteroidota bacterium]